MVNVKENELKVIPAKPTFEEAEVALEKVSKVEIVCTPDNLPKEFRDMVNKFIKKKKSSVFVTSSKYFMALVMWECKVNNIKCRAYIHG